MTANIDMQDRFRGSIVGGAVGDALGAPVEFITDMEGLQAVWPNGPEMLKPFLYTDDTQMSICVARALIESKGDSDRFMDKLSDLFVEWHSEQYEGSPNCRAPGNSCLAGCGNLKAGIPWSEAGVKSEGCGAAMRSGPIGLYHNADMLKVIEWARDSSLPTHATDSAMASSVAAALMVYYAVKDVPPGVWAHELMMPLRGISEDVLNCVQLATQMVAENVGPYIALSSSGIGEAWVGHEAVGCALYCCLRHPDSFEEAVKTAAYSVGDSDSIAAITGSIMGARLGIGAIPPEWEAAIENKQLLLDTADKLLGTSRTMST